MREFRRIVGVDDMFVILLIAFSGRWFLCVQQVVVAAMCWHQVLATMPSTDQVAVNSIQRWPKRDALIAGSTYSASRAVYLPNRSRRMP
jgi:hypothetical protein